MVKVFAPAKINLTLHVTGKRADGYHLLDSLVVFADVGDIVTVTEASETTLTVNGPMARNVPTDARNIMVRAAAFFGQTAALHLTKNLPPAAGIGGGSSDAVATLQGLSQLTGRTIPQDVVRLGADVPVCLLGQTCRMRGVGEDISPLPDMPGLHAVLVNPMVPVLTQSVFTALQSAHNAPMPQDVPRGLSGADLIDWLSGMRNDLEAPALQAEPMIAQVIAALKLTPGCGLVRMSGSGGTCFGLYADADSAASAAQHLSETHPGWWIKAAHLNGS
ncbi:MAG: 4-(cytidine 5'-diphospho)-2-C-methyl-D-erythritol kinase [Roseovarius sp.]